MPGAALGILRVRPGRDDELAEVACGVLNKDTGVPVTTDSLFQIGSISKVWTATLALQLADEGLLDLDAPVAEVLPELRLADPDVTKQVTMRHLLTHTSGIDGDVFTDTGRGDDCVEKYVAQLGDAAQNHPLGATWSYCNSGFALAGRVIEKLTGGTWDAALTRRICRPLGLTHTVTLPEEALLYRTAVGHVGEETDEISRAPVWMLPRSVGPAGLICSSTADVLAFARHAPDRRPGAGRHQGAVGGQRGGDDGAARRAAGPAHPRRLLGAWLDPVRLERPPADRARRQHDRPVRVPADPARRGAGSRAAHQRRQHQGPVRGPVPGDLRRARRHRHADAAGAAGGTSRRRT